MKKALGRYVVADPAICHGQPTFRGTRIFVSDVLDDVARGTAWQAIIKRWHGPSKRKRLPRRSAWREKRYSTIPSISLSPPADECARFSTAAQSAARG